MSIPDLPSFLKDDFVPVKPPHPEFSKAMERYKKHFGRYDFNNWPPSKSENEWAHILNQRNRRKRNIFIQIVKFTLILISVRLLTDI
jgi:hypothetical protein